MVEASIADLTTLPHILEALTGRDFKDESEALREERKLRRFLRYKKPNVNATINLTEGCKVGKRDSVHLKTKAPTNGLTPYLDFGRISEQEDAPPSVIKKGSRASSNEFARGLDVIAGYPTDRPKTLTSSDPRVEEHHREASRLKASGDRQVTKAQPHEFKVAPPKIDKDDKTEYYKKLQERIGSDLPGNTNGKRNPYTGRRS